MMNKIMIIITLKMDTWFDCCNSDVDTVFDYFVCLIVSVLWVVVNESM